MNIQKQLENRLFTIKPEFQVHGTLLDECPYNNGDNYGKQTICEYDCCNTVTCCPDIKTNEHLVQKFV